MPILEEQEDGLKIFTAISLMVVSYIVIVYVDDSDFLIAARHPQESALSIVKRTQHASIKLEEPYARINADGH